MALDNMAREPTLAEGAAGIDEEDLDDPTGYYVAGHDWPAITSTIKIDDLYKALRGIGDIQVKAAERSLLREGRNQDNEANPELRGCNSVVQLRAAQLSALLRACDATAERLLARTP